MSYTIHNQAGAPIGGDRDLDDVVRAAAHLANGYVTDPGGHVVYESPGYLRFKDAADGA